jgi:ApbE superfamily uncharacterized protein (UPF0280 family)
MPRAAARMLDAHRLHLQDGPIDLIVMAEGEGDAERAALAAAERRFVSVLDELCAELPLLRSAADPARLPRGLIARRMWQAVLPFAADTFITPMAAVAGAVADEILAAMAEGVSPQTSSGAAQRPRLSHGERAVSLAERSARLEKQGEGVQPQPRARLTRAAVNNGGDIAVHLATGAAWRVGLVDRPDRPSLFGTTTLRGGDGIGGIATSGWRGRSFSLGIADAVTVLAATAAAADAAATVIANAVDLPGHAAITRIPATDLQPDSDLGNRLVTRGVGPLVQADIATALAAGATVARGLLGRCLIAGAALHLAGRTEVVDKDTSAAAPRELLHA